MKTSTHVKFSLVLLFLVWGAMPVVAQQGSGPAWASGRVQLAQGDWLTADLRYNPDLGLLEVAVDGIHQTLPAQKVASFYFYDSSLARNRTFYVLPYSRVGQPSLPTFFEQVVEGRMGLLAREEVHHSGLLRRMIGRGSNDYFFLTSTGEIVPYRHQVSQLYRLLRDRRNEVAFFVDRVKWFKQEEKPVAELVRYYNSLEETN